MALAGSSSSAVSSASSGLDVSTSAEVVVSVASRNAGSAAREVSGVLFMVVAMVPFAEIGCLAPGDEAGVLQSAAPSPKTSCQGWLAN